MTSILASGFETANIATKTDYGKPGGNSTTFASEGLTSFYKPADHWEGLHRYDPDFAWEPAEEKALVRKIDWRICTFACLMFFALQ